MLKTHFKFTMFILSYFPLYILLLIKNFDVSKLKELGIKYFMENIYYYIIIMILIGISLYALIRIKGFKNNQKQKINNPKNNTYDTLAYLVTFVIPILYFDLSDEKSIIINCLLFVLYGIFYINSNILNMNPSLVIIGYKVYNFDDNKILITKKSIDEIRNENIPVKEISDYIFINK